LDGPIDWIALFVVEQLTGSRDAEGLTPAGTNIDRQTAFG
jgi:hypothetical protein